MEDLILFGFRSDGKDYTEMLHWDPYSGLENEVLEFCKKYGQDGVEDIFSSIACVNYTEPMSILDLDHMEKNGWKMDNSDLYKWIGDVLCIRSDIDENGSFMESHYTIPYPYMIQRSEYMRKSSFIRKAYLVNLDDQILEVWEGQQREPDYKNRYGIKPYECDGGLYYPCKMISFYKLWESEEDEFTCPKCGAIMSNKKSFFNCDDCGFCISKTYLGVELSKKQISDLLQKKETDEIVFPRGSMLMRKRPFKARIKLDKRWLTHLSEIKDV